MDAPNLDAAHLDDLLTAALGMVRRPDPDRGYCLELAAVLRHRGADLARSIADALAHGRNSTAGIAGTVADITIAIDRAELAARRATLKGA